MRTIGKIKELLRDLAPDVVHTHQVGALFYAGPAARALRVPAVIHTEHGKHYASRFRTRLVGRWATRYAEKFIAVNRDIADEALSYHIAPAHKVGVVANGIDVSCFASQSADEALKLRHTLGIPAEARVIGTVGRLDEIKQQDLLVRATATLQAHLANVHLLLVGDGPRRDSLQALTADLGLGQRVHFAGYQSEPQRYFRVMDVFALPSRSEGLPLAILEAWAASIPVVASRVGGLPNLIQHGDTGLLFAPGDEKALADALHSVLTSAVLAGKLGAAGLRRVSADFTVQRMAAEYQQHYLGVLRGAAKQPALASV